MGKKANKARKQGYRISLSASAAWLIALCLWASCEDSQNEAAATDDFPRQSCHAVAFIPAEGGPAFVRFTDEQLPDITMRDSNGDGVLEAVLTGEPGSHNYLVFQNGVGVLDPFNTQTGYSPSYSQEVSRLTIPDCHIPKVTISSLAASAGGQLWLQGQWFLAADGAPLNKNSLSCTIDGQKAAALIMQDNGSFVVESGGIAIGKHELTITGSDTSGRPARPRRATFWVEEQPFTWADSHIYQVFVDRFANEDGELVGEKPISYFHGGNLQGVIKKLKEGYFTNLSVNVLWLSPLYQNPAGRFLGRDGFYAEPYHGYWPLNMRQIDRRFGNADDLHELVDLAHQKGIRVILDSVLNHVHIQNSYFVNHWADGWFNNIQSDCICGVTCDWGAHYEDCWFDPFLADLSWEQEEQMETLVADHIYWLETFNLDGLRMDAVPMMPRRAMRRMRAAINERFDPAGAHVYLIGENYTSRGEQPNIRYYLGPHTLSGLFDFPLMWALRQTLDGLITPKDLDNEIKRSAAAWDGSGAVMGIFLGNHDVPRFISSANGDEIWQPREIQPESPKSALPYERLQLAWSLLYTLPGAPVIYYGDEIGMPGANDPDNRRNMRFNNLNSLERSMLNHVQKMAHIRASCPVFRRGDRTTLLVNSTHYVYLRAYEGKLAIVAFNNGDKPADLSFEIPAKYLPTVPKHFTDLMTSASYTLSSRVMQLGVDPHAVKVLASTGSCGEE